MATAVAELPWTPERSAAGGLNPWSMVGIVSLATLMVALDSTIVTVALAHIAGNLAVSYDESTWVITSYLVATAVTIPVSGWLANAIGRKRYYMISVALFTGSSLACAFSPNLTVLILMRCLQGVGGGGLTPVEQSILADTFPPSKRSMAFAAYGLVIVTGPIFGPILGGWITDNFSWQWCFLINVPIGLLSLFLVGLFLDEPKAVREHTAHLRAGGLNIDYVGFALVALFLGCLEITLERGQRYDWFASPLIVVTAVVCVMALCAFIPWELLQREPVVDLKLFRRRNFAICSVLFLIIGMVIFGTTQFIPQLLQAVLGYSATEAGLALTAGGLVILVMLPVVGVLTERTDLRYLVGFGLLMQVVAFWAMGHLATQMTFADAAWVRTLQTIGVPFLFVPVMTVAYVGLRAEENNQASALMNVLLNLGGTVGIATMQTLLARGRQINQSYLVERLNPFNPVYVQTTRHLTLALTGHAAHDPVISGPAAGVIYENVQQQAAMLSYVHVFYVLMFVTMAYLPFLLLMRKGAATAATRGGI